MYWKRALAAGVGTMALLVGGAVHASPASALDLNCTTYVHNNDPNTGIAFCDNPTGRTIAFRAVVVCGWAPDVYGQWVTLAPGRVGQSQATCAFYSTGVGAIGVDERYV
ncbi:hypothetical protein [Thermobifida cellulosilytica]|nr:hypothetical protein [Thermobifida cellulosilytica]